MSYVKEYAGKNNEDVDFGKSAGNLLSEIQEEIESCYNNYCKLNKDDMDIDSGKIINENIKQRNQELKNLSDRDWYSSISDTCKDVLKNVGSFFLKTGKGKVVKSFKQIVPNKHISPNMDPKDQQFMFNLYEKIRHKQEIKINFVDKCSQEQSDKNRDTNSDTLYLSREMFEKVYKVFTKTKFEKEKMPTQTHLNLFTQTYTLLFGETWNTSFLKAFNKPDFSREKDIFSLEEIPQMKWKVKKMMVNGKLRSTKNETTCTTKTLEYFFADISNYIQDHRYQGLKGNTKSTREKTNAIIQYNKINKESNNSRSSINTSITSRKSLEASSKK
ncbi:MAG: hypothetical protein IJT15_02405 [Rickettsiales bacterium]|nr:hypothetical protein [Rickettsiales bacterium]